MPDFDADDSPNGTRGMTLEGSSKEDRSLHSLGQLICGNFIPDA
jgi:hypothetical protein